MKKLISGLALVAATTLAMSCSKEETPKPSTPTTPTKQFTEVQLTSVTLNSIPMVNGSGVGWDLSNGPDVYFQISESSTSTTVAFKDSRYNDVTSNMFPLQWNFTTPVKLDTASDYLVSVYDYDSPDPDDYIGYTGFDLSSLKTKNYPDSLTSSYFGVTATLYFKYQ